MRSSYVAWDDAVDLFERRGLPKGTYENLYEEEYILVPGPAAVTGELPLDEHERTPWSDGTPEAATGYVVDGDLVVDGNITDVDDGAAALIVLGDLRARNIYLAGDAKLVVRGHVTAETFVGDMTDKLVMIHGTCAPPSRSSGTSSAPTWSPAPPSPRPRDLRAAGHLRRGRRARHGPVGCRHQHADAGGALKV